MDKMAESAFDAKAYVEGRSVAVEVERQADVDTAPKLLAIRLEN